MPAYSIGKQKKQPTFVKKDNNPGVGSYTTQGWHKQSKNRSSSSVSMTKADKFYNTYKSIDYQAGPGSYNPEKIKTNICTTIKGKSRTHFKTDIPGPAQYNPKSLNSNREHSFGNSRRKLVTRDGPAPNNYTLPSQHSHSGIKFNHEQKNKGNNYKGPGPGEYTQSLNNLIAYQYTFTRQKKFKQEQNTQKTKKYVPGPGNYDLSNFKKRLRGGKFYQASRQCISISKNYPGPGQYSTQTSISKQHPRAVIGGQTRKSIKKDETPGPGQYKIPSAEITKRNYGKTAFSRDDRQLKDSRLTPGPGSYETVKKKNSRGIEIASRNFYTHQQLTPSPQDYNPEYKYLEKSCEKATIGKQEKYKRIKTEAPGPGQYNLQGGNKFAKTFYFGRAKKIHSSNYTIGPGQYKLKPYFGVCDGLQRQQKDYLYV